MNNVLFYRMKYIYDSMKNVAVLQSVFCQDKWYLINVKIYEDAWNTHRNSNE
jgi:hypothetical protein